MTKPLCTVVMPTRDCLSYLKKSIPTIYAQDAGPIEIIVVDDGSCDGSLDYLYECARMDPDFVVLETGGIGPGRARNAAIAKARGELIAFLDADDLWLEGKLARQLAFHSANPEIGLSFCDYTAFTTEATVPGSCFSYWNVRFSGAKAAGYHMLDGAEAVLLSHNIVGTSAVVAKRELLQNANGFLTDLQSATDWDMWLKLAAMAPVGISAEIGMLYLMRTGSVTQNRQNRIDAMETIVSRYRGRREVPMRRAVRLAEANIAIARAEYDLEAGRPFSSMRHFGAALSRRLDRRTFRAAGQALFDGLAETLWRKRVA